MLAFAGVYCGLFTLAAAGNPARVAEMFRAPFVHAALSVAAFMLTDPPTSPGATADQLWFGGLVAASAVAARLLGAGETYLLIGLLAGNAVLAGRRWLAGRGSSRRGPARSWPV